ncbi:hypothetical protein GJ496_009424 [Pomphorhynchus laevis]|nr:hypothetical protein GJ496_009424 [Pomphorhynchus laevis]
MTEIKAEMICHECCENEATLRCLDCSANLCQSCFLKIHEHRVLRNHTSDIIHSSSECILCDHSRWCEKDQSSEFPSDFRLYLKNSSIMQSKLESSYKDSVERLKMFFEPIQNSIKLVLNAKLSQLKNRYAEMLSEFDSSLLSTLSSHAIRKICACESLHEQIRELVNKADSRQSEIDVDVYDCDDDMLQHFTSYLEDCVGIIGTNKISKKPKCCYDINDGLENDGTDMLNTLLKSDGKAGRLLHSLFKYSDLKLNSIYSVVHHIGFEAVIIKPVDAGEIVISKSEDKGFSALQLRCCPSTKIIVLELDKDGVDFELSSSELLAYNINSGKIMLVQRDHLVPTDVPQLVTAIPGCIFEPLLDLRCKSDLLYDDSILKEQNFTLLGYTISNSDRCIFDLQIHSSVNSKKTLIHYLSSTQSFDCLQTISMYPSIKSTLFSINDYALVVSVQSQNSLFVQLDTKQFSDIESKVASNLLTDQIIKNKRIGTWYLSKYDNVICRAILAGMFTSPNSNRVFLIYYPDYGNLELVSAKDNHLWQIPSALSDLPCTLQRLALDCTESRERSIDELKTLYENSLVNLRSLQPKVLGVPAKLTWIDLKQQRIYVQRDDTKVLREISNLLNDGSVPVNEVCLQSLIQIYSKERKCICRGLVESIVNGKGRVRLVDYGNVIYDVILSAVNECTADQSAYPPQAIRCIIDKVDKVKLYSILNKANQRGIVYNTSDDNLWSNDTPITVYSQNPDNDPVIQFEFEN